MITINTTIDELRKEVSNMTRMLQIVPRRRRYLPIVPDMDIFDRFFDFELPTLFDKKEMVVPHFDITETEIRILGYCNKCRQKKGRKV